MFNLFDVHTGCNSLSPKPRNATDDEVRAYLQWIAAKQGVTIPANAAYHPAGIWCPAAREYIVAMPGHDQTQIVTCEILDDAGNVVRSLPLPQDKRGGIPATAKQIQQWSGLTPVKGKRAKAAAIIDVDMPSPGAPEAKAAPSPVSDTPEAPEALHAAPEPNFDALSSIADRVAALELAISTLSANKRDTPIGETASQGRAKRTPAHERAIRRAWAERKARRAARFTASLKRDQLDKANRSIAYWRGMAEGLQEKCDEWEALQHRTWEEAMGHKMKRRRAVLTARRQWKMRLLARQQNFASEAREREQRELRRRSAERSRRMIAAARQAATDQRRRAQVAEAGLAKLRKDMADASAPERASDIARLVRERDEARTALAAVEARAQRLQASVDQMAGQFDQLVSRVARAETMLRQQSAA